MLMTSSVSLLAGMGWLSLNPASVDGAGSAQARQMIRLKYEPPGAIPVDGSQATCNA